jgi:hypothetical protein
VENSSWRDGTCLPWRHRRNLVSRLQYHSELFPQDWLSRTVLLWLVWHCNKSMRSLKTKHHVHSYIQLFLNTRLTFLLPNLRKNCQWILHKLNNKWNSWSKVLLEKLGANILLSNTLNPCSSLNVRDQLSHTYINFICANRMLWNILTYHLSSICLPNDFSELCHVISLERKRNKYIYKQGKKNIG